jgi:hypothetical protein
MSLAEFAQKYIPANAQSRIVLGDDHERLDAEQIRQRLNDRYTLVGYTEAFDEFVYLLHESEGLPLATYGNRLVRAERDSYVPSELDLESVRRSQSVDALLHQVVKEDFQARIDQLSDGSRAAMANFLDSLRIFRETSVERQ